ncbi:MAG: hypothetical protein R3Y63_13535 [Eubacteriales bacterium]
MVKSSHTTKAMVEDVQGSLEDLLVCAVLYLTKPRPKTGRETPSLSLVHIFWQKPLRLLHFRRQIHRARLLLCQLLHDSTHSTHPPKFLIERTSSKALCHFPPETTVPTDKTSADTVVKSSPTTKAMGEDFQGSLEDLLVCASVPAVIFSPL